MIAAFLSGIAASLWVRAALHYGAVALATLLFLVPLRAHGEQRSS